MTAVTAPTPRLPDPRMLIDGALVRAGDGRTRDVVNPATGDVLLRVPEAGPEAAADAIGAARRAFDEGPWARSTPQARARTLECVADALERDAERFAALETLDTGKPVAESRDDVAQVAAVFRYYAALLRTRTGDVNPVPDGALSLTLHRPAGVAVMITPWNYPLLQASWKVAPGLAAGCSFVIKPSELTPLTTMALGELLLDAGVPNGVANVVTGAGPDLGAALVADERIDMISFTGGLTTGREIARTAAERAIRVALELGGKNPNIVLADADLEVAADRALDAVFFHAGQVCSAGSRLLLDDAVHDEVVGAILARAAHIRLGFGWEDDTEMGPLISHRHRERVEGYVALAQQEGATLRLGGTRPTSARLAGGAYLQPTVLTGLREDGRVAREEIFGPVLTVERVHGLDDALRRANATETGLAAAIWTADAGTALDAASRLRFGTVWWNDFHPYFPEAPWGGFKASGVGRELGRSGLREYQEEQHVYLNLRPRAGGAFGARDAT
jgi:betaine-aldehyde dehydrogenase